MLNADRFSNPNPECKENARGMLFRVAVALLLLFFLCFLASLFFVMLLFLLGFFLLGFLTLLFDLLGCLLPEFFLGVPCMSVFVSRCLVENEKGLLTLGTR